MPSLLFSGPGFSSVTRPFKPGFSFWHPEPHYYTFSRFIRDRNFVRQDTIAASARALPATYGDNRNRLNSF